MVETRFRVAIFAINNVTHRKSLKKMEIFKFYINKCVAYVQPYKKIVQSRSSQGLRGLFKGDIFDGINASTAIADLVKYYLDVSNRKSLRKLDL